MTQVSLSSVITEKFLGRLSSVAGSNTSSPVQKSKSSDSLASTLQFGARSFTYAIQNINDAAAIVNVSDAALIKLSRITEKLISITEDATAGNIGVQNRGRLDGEYRKLAAEFRDVVEDTEVQGKEILREAGLEDVFLQVGLDTAKSSELAELFDSFMSPKDDDLLASEKTRAPGPVKIPAQAYLAPDGTQKYSKRSQEFSSVFSSTRDIRTPPHAYAAWADLKELSKQIKNNREVLQETRDYLQKNLDLVRATGLAFLDMADKVKSTDTAADVTQSLIFSDSAQCTGGTFSSEQLR